MKSLEGKVAIVTGASRGIGAGIAEEFAKRGAAKIAITYLKNASDAEAIVQKLKAYGATAVAIKADVADLAAAPSVIEQALSALDATELDILVNNAANALFRPFDDNTVDDFHTVFNTNVGGVVFLIKAALPKMRRGGRIINISSRLARFTRGDPLILYSSSKAALEHLTRQLAFRYAAPLGITVNTVMPGPTDTGDWVKMPESIEHLLIRSPDAMEKYTTEVELLRNAATAEKRLGTVDDIAQVVTFVAEEGSRWINGDTINASGGAGMF